MELELEQMGQMLANPACSHIHPLLAHAEHCAHPPSLHALYFTFALPLPGRSSPDIPVIPSFTSFMSLFKCHLLQELPWAPYLPWKPTLGPPPLLCFSAYQSSFFQHIIC